ncbi:hypothetical protein DFH28DRAFT_329537 [Melampsora americana]|nr:hypothetical protein DFH28DRAFT_329537 [Melampsora americana]
MHLDHWRKIELRNSFLGGSSEMIFENDQLRESHSLFINMLTLKINCWVPFDMISKLHYLQSLSLSNVIQAEGFEKHCAQLNSKLTQTFWDVQRQLKRIHVKKTSQSSRPLRTQCDKNQ